MKASNDLYKKKAKSLDPKTLENFESDLIKLDQALLSKDQKTADEIARKLEAFNQIHFKKSYFEYATELLIALVFALAIATVVRQVWFELYEIPTGSMRPTFKEQDHLTVSKLAFGINVPLKTEHFYFDPSLVQRTSIVIFSGENVPIIDTKTAYFWVFPYTKRYIKRLIGKPGDSLYFYGGKIYGVDKDGNLIKDLLESPWMEKLEHVPFLSFEGLVSAPTSNQVLFRHMHQPVAKLTLANNGNFVGEVFNGKEWVKDQPNSQNESHSSIQSYSDLWGIKNYAMARLLTKKQLQEDPSINSDGVDEGILYLELRHNPSLTYPKPKFHHDMRGTVIALSPYRSIIPLQQHHLDAIMNNMYTARFVIKNEKAHRYTVEDNYSNSTTPKFAGVKDGIYEFYHGKGEKVGWAGITSPMSQDNPLYKHTPENIQKLYNLGIEVNTAYMPRAGNQNIFPQRYAYFRNGDLYLLGAPVIKKDDPTLTKFIERENKRAEQSSNAKPYVPFKDNGPPLNEDGSANLEFIRNFGITVPENEYLVLGDNHAMSSDSRVFGFVPQNNLQGAPSLIIWPIGDRVGSPAQKPYQIINLPRIIIWSIATLAFIIWYILHRRNLKRPIFKKIRK